MPQPRFEVPLGAIDGINTTFTVSTAYQPGSVAVFYNGQLKTRALDDGWVETNPVLGIVTLKEAPHSFATHSDVVQIFYLDTSPVLPETVVEHITGALLDDVDTMVGTLLSDSAIFGTWDTADSLAGSLVGSALQGLLEDAGALRGRMEVCQ